MSSLHSDTRKLRSLPVPSAEHVAVARDRIVSAFAPLQIMVFGSYARGDVRPGSDLDLLVVFKSIEDKREASLSIRRLLADLPVPKDIIVTTPEELESRKNSTWHIVAQAAREGRVIHPTKPDD